MNVAEEELEGSRGVPSMDGLAGAVVSTVQVKEVAPLVLPTPSVAFTEKVWEPSDRLE